MKTNRNNCLILMKIFLVVIALFFLLKTAITEPNSKIKNKKKYTYCKYRFRVIDYINYSFI